MVVYYLFGQSAGQVPWVQFTPGVAWMSPLAAQLVQPVGLLYGNDAHGL